VTPRIVAHGAQQLVEFITHVFDATGTYSAERRSMIHIGDSAIMISEAGTRDPMPAFLYVYVENTDRTYARALATGATSLEEPFATPYGDRRAMIEDRWGNIWQIATPSVPA
jgi:PhnB protein